MLSSRLPADIGSDVIKVPLPPSLIRAFGCRPGTSIFLDVVDGQIRVVPDPIPPAKQAATANDVGIAESCRRWWKSQ
jgi:hypothetical protein